MLAARFPVITAGCSPAALLALSFFVLCAWSSARAADREKKPRREALLRAAVVWGVAVWAGTEALSSFHALTPLAAVLYWSLLNVAAFGWILRTHLVPHPARVPPAMLRTVDLSTLALAGALLALLGVAAAVSAPNNYDSMTYHLSRVCHWIQNRSVDFYATNIDRQNFLQPWSEFAILHLNLLAGSDRLDNLVQWTSLLGTLVGVSLLAARCGAGRTGQIFAVVFVSTLPMAVMQATSTQTQLVVSLWLVCFVYFSLELVEAPGPVPALFTGGSLGLAWLTHATAWLFAFPWIAGLLAFGLRRRHARFIVFYGCAGLLAILINTGHWARNLGLYGDILGPPPDAAHVDYMNRTHDWAAMVSVVLRNLAPQLAVPVPWWVDRLNRAVFALHRLLGTDPNNPLTTWPATTFQINVPCFTENCIGNPVHFIVILASMALLAIRWKWRPTARRGGPRLTGLLALNATAAFLLFCFLLKWQPWHPRLHLPLFALIAPCVGANLERRLPRWGTRLVAAALLVLGWRVIAYNPVRPVFGDVEIFSTPRLVVGFGSNPWLAQPYSRAVNFVAKVRPEADIGLVFLEDDWEYPLWVLFPAVEQRSPRIEHVLVKNETAALAPKGFQPGAIVTTQRLTDRELRKIKDTAWLVKEFNYLNVYIASGDFPPQKGLTPVR